MGKLALATKITHVPSMYLSELPGRHQGCRQAAFDGHVEIGRRRRALSVDAIVVLDLHWLVNAGYHVNCCERFRGVYTSNELPHFIQDMSYDYPGNPALGRVIAETATQRGIFTRAHEVASLDLEYGTLVPMRYMNQDRHFQLVSTPAWCNWHTPEDSRRFGAAVREAIERSGHTVAVFASGSQFNRLIASVAAGGPPIVIRDSAPRVELALSRAVRIPWDQHDDLYPDDGDSCIVAEVLHAKDMSVAGKLIVSHDIKPIAFASNYDVATLHVSDSWLRQPEPHPKDREIQKLNQQLAQYQAKEPAFAIVIELIDAEPVALVRIEDLTDAECATIHRRIHDLNPPAEQDRGPYGIALSLGTYDHCYDERFKAYRKRVPIFMANYAQRLERLFNHSAF